jgi:hypothetical protein
MAREVHKTSEHDFVRQGMDVIAAHYDQKIAALEGPIDAAIHPLEFDRATETLGST